MKEVIHHTAYMKWGELRAFPGPADGKILREDAETGAKTLLVRLPPGAHVIAHGHRGIVQHYVLEGQYETEGQLFGPGSYRMMPEHYDVPSISTTEGVTILMIFDPVCK